MGLYLESWSTTVWDIESGENIIYYIIIEYSTSLVPVTVQIIIFPN